MFCLLCHEKISRLRAWRTKSEFCCDEHAEIYKRQTLERLLTDQDNSNPTEAPPLPVDNSPRREGRRAPAPVQETQIPPPLAGLREGDSPAAGLEERFQLRDSHPLEEDRDEGVRELYRLAEEVGPGGSGNDDWAAAGPTLSGDAGLRPASLGGGLGGGSGAVPEQSPEEALAALRALSTRRSGDTLLDDGGDDFETLLASHESAKTPQPGIQDDLDDLSDVGAPLEAALPDEDSLPSFDMSSLEPLDDDELPSILDRLTESDRVGAASQDATDSWDLGDTGGLLSDLEPLPELEESLLGLPGETQSGAAEAEIDARAEEPAAELSGDELPAAELSGGAESTTENAATEDLEPAEQLAAESAAVQADEIAAAGSAVDELESGEIPELSDEALELTPLTDDSGAFDLLEEAVESHLEEPKQKPVERGNRKVVPFPLSRQKRDEPPPAAAKPADSQRAAASSQREKPSKPAGRQKSGKGKNNVDLSRVHLKPVAVMFGLEPSLREPASDVAQVEVAAANGFAEPPLHYPQPARPGPVDTKLRVHARLYRALPELREAATLSDDAKRPDAPNFALPCASPQALLQLATRPSGKPSLGSERAWMVRIEPSLAEAAEFVVPMSNGGEHSPWQSPRLPAALLAGLMMQLSPGKLDLSGASGEFQPSVDRLCLVLPELGDLGGGRQSATKAGGEQMGWMPPTVLDPRFDIERPAGRDLSDFG